MRRQKAKCAKRGKHLSKKRTRRNVTGVAVGMKEWTKFNAVKTEGETKKNKKKGK